MGPLLVRVEVEEEVGLFWLFFFFCLHNAEMRTKLKTITRIRIFLRKHIGMKRGRLYSHECHGPLVLTHVDDGGEHGQPDEQDSGHHRQGAYEAHEQTQ